MVAPDDTTFAWVDGRPGAPRGLRRRRRALARAAHRRRARRSTREVAVDAGASARWSPGARTPSMVVGVAERRAASPQDRGRRARARVHGPRGRHADRGDPARPRLHRLVHELAHRRPARRGARSSRAARSPATSTRWSSRARVQVKRQAEAEGLDEVFQRGRLRLARRRLLDVPGHEPRHPAAGRALRLDLEPQLRGPPGPRRPHPPRLARRWPPPRRSRAASSTSATGADRPWTPSPVIDGRRQRARPRRRRHRPDHPQAVPQARRAHRLRRVPVLRLGQGARLGPAANPILVTGRTSAAARRASTRRGRSRTTASRRSSRRASPTSSTPTARRSGCCRSRCRPTTCEAIAAAGERARSTSTPRRCAATGGVGALRDRPRRQAPAAQRPRRHRADAAAGGRDRRLRGATASAPARSRRRSEPATWRRRSSPCPATASAPRSRRAAHRGC